MNIPGFTTLIVSSMVLLAAPAYASETEAAAWSAVQKINEMAEETRARCSAGKTAACGEASAITGTTFQIVTDARLCATGRYPVTCSKLRKTLAEVDVMYEAYLAEAGPARVASNKARLQCGALPFGGTCETGEGIVQTQLTAPQQ